MFLNQNHSYIINEVKPQDLNFFKQMAPKKTSTTKKAPESEEYFSILSE